MKRPVSVCRSCGASILWAATASGRSTPLDAGPHPEGNLYLDGDVARVAVAARAAPEGAPLYRSHFATCPQAARHRRPKPAAPETPR